MRRSAAAAMAAALMASAAAMPARAGETLDGKPLDVGWIAGSHLDGGDPAVVAADHVNRWLHNEYGHFARDYLYPWPSDRAPIFSAGILESGMLWIGKPGRYAIRGTVEINYVADEKAAASCVQRLAADGATIISTDGVGWDKEGAKKDARSAQLRSGMSRKFEFTEPGYVRLDHFYRCTLGDPAKEIKMLAQDILADKSIHKGLMPWTTTDSEVAKGWRFRSDRYPDRSRVEWRTGAHIMLDLIDEDGRVIPIDGSKNVFHVKDGAPVATATSFAPAPLMETPATWQGLLTNARDGSVLRDVDFKGHQINVAGFMAQADLPNTKVSIQGRFMGKQVERVGIAVGLRQNELEMFPRQCPTTITAKAVDGRVGELWRGTITSERVGSTWGFAWADLEPGDVLEIKPDCGGDDPATTLRRTERSNLISDDGTKLVLFVQRKSDFGFRAPTRGDFRSPASVPAPAR